MIHKIYALSSSNNPQNYRYIGQTTQKLNRRLSNHISEAMRNKRFNHRVNWIRKQLKLNNVIIITELDEVSSEIWKETEINYIKLFKSFGAKLINSTNGGEEGLNKNAIKKSLETKRKNKERKIISQKNKLVNKYYKLSLK